MIGLSSVLFLAFLLVKVESAQECYKRDYSHGSVVCVCNVTHCDDLDPIKKTATDVITVYETNKAGDRLKASQLKFGDKHEAGKEKATITIDRSKKYQTIIGFGGAFTDAAGLNIHSLPDKMQERLIDDYFSDRGIEYTMGRVTIAGSDFSTRGYTYDDANKDDYDWKHFALQMEDHTYKIPYLKQAKKVSPHEVKWFGSTWAPPAWLKSNGKLNSGGRLIGEPGGKQYKAFAQYLVKFLDAYKAEGVPIWGLTVENEPVNGDKKGWGLSCLGFTAELQRDFIKMDLGPALEKAGYGPNNTKLMFYDDNLGALSQWIDVMYSDKEASKYVAGLAFHWYENNDKNIQYLDKAHETDSSKFLLNTEACDGWHNALGDWAPFEHYSRDIITDLNHYASGWVDWNMVLSNKGGPNFANNMVNAPVIVNAEAKEYYKQPMFYALGHYSKFLVQGSQRIGHTQTSSNNRFFSTVFVRPDNGTVVVAINNNNEDLTLTIDDNKKTVSHLAKANSIQTYLFY